MDEETTTDGSIKRVSLQEFRENPTEIIASTLLDGPIEVVDLDGKRAMYLSSPTGEEDYDEGR